MRNLKNLEFTLKLKGNLTTFEVEIEGRRYLKTTDDNYINYRRFYDLTKTALNFFSAGDDDDLKLSSYKIKFFIEKEVNNGKKIINILNELYEEIKKEIDFIDENIDVFDITKTFMF